MADAGISNPSRPDEERTSGIPGGTVREPRPPDRRVSTGELLVTAAVMSGVLLCRFDLNHEPRADLSGLVSGSAHKPFVYRILLPAVIRIVQLIIPADERAALENRLESTPAIAGLVSHAGAANGQALESFLALLLMALCLVGFGLSFRRLVETTCPHPQREARFLLLGAFVCLVPLRVGYLYDFACLFLITLCLVLLAEARWGSYLAAFLFATLAKETSLLLILFFAVHFRGLLNGALFRKLLVMQCAIYAVIRLILVAAFWSNPGVPMEIHPLIHVRSAGQRPLLTVVFYLVGLAVVATAAYRWKEKPKFLRDAAACMVPPMFVLYLVAGYPYEVRVFYEVYAVVFLLCAGTFLRLARRRRAREMIAR